MVMDLVTGGELFDAVAEHGRLDESRARLYFQQLVDGVHYCHSRRVFHRDLKPENLLLSGDKQTLKITDFGLSSIKAQNASSELLHTIMGSPHYIAPEIITSAAAGYEGGKVDVWASGVILYGMLAGFLPFDEPSTRALYRAIVHNQVSYPPHFSYDVVKLLRAMLQKDPRNRATMELVKTFPWFKVGYEPSFQPEQHQKQTASRSGSAKKSKVRAKRHSERLPKQKQRDTPEIPEMDSNARQGGAGPQGVQQGENHVYESFDSKPISELFRDPSRGSSPPDEQATRTQNASRRSSNAGNESGQENIDPHQGPCRQPVGKPAVNPAESPAKPQSSSHSIKANLSFRGMARPLDPAVPAVAHRTGRPLDIADRVSASSTPRVERIHSASTTPTLTAQKKRASSELVWVPKTRSSRGEPEEHRKAVPGGVGVQEDPNTLPSPLTPQVSRFSPANSSNAGSGPEERRQESVRCARNAYELKQPSLNEFVSPLSEKSKSSFSSPLAEKGEVSVLSPNYRTLVPLLFRSEGSQDLRSDNCVELRRTDLLAPLGEGQPVSTQIRELEKGNSDPSTDRTGLVQDQEHKDRELCPSECQLAAEQVQEPKPMEQEKQVADQQTGDMKSPSEQKSIFGPMKSLFAKLAEDGDVRKAPSMSASVFCPEFDYEEDGSPQWCLDSMEVFADFEPDCPGEPTVTKGRSLNFLETMKQARSQTSVTPSEDVKEESRNEKSSSIFSPLDDEVMTQLSPTAKEGKSSNVLRAAPLVRP